MNILNIPALISAFFNFILTMLITVVQILTWPVNEVIKASFPDLATHIVNLVNYLGQLLQWFPYILSFLPPTVLPLLIFMLGAEITLMYMFQTTYYVTKLWRIIQAVKFW